MANDQRFPPRSFWIGSLAGAFLLFTQQPGFAQGQCDCSRILGQCQSTVSFRPKSVTIKSNTNQCSWVQFSVNGDPHTSTFKGGSNSEEWLGSPPRQGQVSVDSCRICASVGQSSMDTPSPSPAPSPGSGRSAGVPNGTYVQTSTRQYPGATTHSRNTLNITLRSSGRMSSEVNTEFDASHNAKGCPPGTKSMNFVGIMNFSIEMSADGSDVTLHPIGQPLFTNINPPCSNVTTSPETAENQILRWDGNTLSDSDGPFYRVQ
jgi:hypothetical protein